MEGLNLRLEPRGKQAWAFALYQHNPESAQWLKSSSLSHACFPSRREARIRLEDLLALHPPPPEMRPETPSLLNQGGGVYRSRCGQWEISRSRICQGGPWRARVRGRDAVPIYARSLSEIRLRIWAAQQITRQL